jgi:hypothetical protein
MKIYFDRITVNCIADKYRGVVVQVLRRVLHDESCMMGDIGLMECSTASSHAATCPVQHHLRADAELEACK